MTMFLLYIEDLCKLGQSAQNPRFKYSKKCFNLFVFRYLVRAKGKSLFHY